MLVGKIISGIIGKVQNVGDRLSPGRWDANITKKVCKQYKNRDAMIDDYKKKRNF